MTNAPDPHAPAQHDSTAEQGHVPELTREEEMLLRDIHETSLPDSFVKYLRPEYKGAHQNLVQFGLIEISVLDNQWYVANDGDPRNPMPAYSTQTTPTPAVPVPDAVDTEYIKVAQTGITEYIKANRAANQPQPAPVAAVPERVVLPFIVGQRVADISRSKRGIVTYVGSGWLEYQDILTDETFAVENEYVSR